MSAKTQRNVHTSVLQQLALLNGMTLPQLQEKWISLFGGSPHNYKREVIVRRLAHRLQEIYFGKISDTIKSKVDEAIATDPICKTEATLSQVKKEDSNLLSGTRLIRIWNGKKYEVITKEGGFEFEGRYFRSLSAIAREITGTRWNGKVFFGVKK